MIFDYVKGYKDGGRNAVAISEEDFIELLKKQAMKSEDIAPEDIDFEDEYWMSQLMEEFFYKCQDFRKIETYAENFDATGNEFGNPDICGVHTLRNGLTFLGFCCGGDGEIPFYCIVYYDGKKLRGYIPENGNPWNTDLRCAFGSDNNTDKYDAYLEKAAKQGYKLDEDMDYSMAYVKLFCELHDIDFDDDEDYLVDCDSDIIEEDITRRITIK